MRGCHCTAALSHEVLFLNTGHGCFILVCSAAQTIACTAERSVHQIRYSRHAQSILCCSGGVCFDFQKPSELSQHEAQFCKCHVPDTSRASSPACPRVGCPTWGTGAMIGIQTALTVLCDGIRVCVWPWPVTTAFLI